MHYQAESKTELIDKIIKGHFTSYGLSNYDFHQKYIKKNAFFKDEYERFYMVIKSQDYIK